jgi:hypothetical protein
MGSQLGDYSASFIEGGARRQYLPVGATEALQKSGEIFDFTVRNNIINILK